MSLLVDMWTNALDPGYAAAAAGRQATGMSARSRRGGPFLLVGLLAASFLVVVAAVQAHTRAPAAARAHDRLVGEVQQESQAVSRLAGQVDDLRAATARLRDDSLRGTTAGARLAGQLAGAELAAGTVAVAGPGLRVTLDDARATQGGSGGNQGGSGNPPNRVQDRDLQSVVNALWAAGAEAIAINGQRLTAQSSIRQAGDAILVDFQPLRAPYVVSAIGDPVATETAFAQSPAADKMRGYAQLYGLHFSYARAAHVVLPAAAEEPLHAAKPLANRSGG